MPLPLPPDGFRARVDVRIPSRLSPGSFVDLRCRVANVGAAMLDSEPPNPVHLSYRWFEEVDVVDLEANRTVLPEPLAPGTEMTLNLPVAVPEAPGNYRLRVALVQEHVAWLTARSTPSCASPRSSTSAWTTRGSARRGNAAGSARRSRAGDRRASQGDRPQRNAADHGPVRASRGPWMDPSVRPRGRRASSRHAGPRRVRPGRSSSTRAPAGSRAISSAQTIPATRTMLLVRIALPTGPPRPAPWCASVRCSPAEANRLGSGLAIMEAARHRAQR